MSDELATSPATTHSARVAPRWWWAAAVFVVAALIGNSFLASAYGLTYDEPVYAAVGQRHAKWIGQAIRFERQAWTLDDLEAGWGNSGPVPALADWHPPIGKLWLHVWRQLPNPFGPLAQYRLGASLLWAGTAAVLLLWLSEAVGLLAGLAAACAWLAWPSAAEHGNLAALDGPVAFGSVLCLWLAWRAMERPSLDRLAAYGVAFGLAMATKFNAILVAPPVLLASALWYRRSLAGLAMATCVVAPAVFVATWPWLWYDGWQHLRAVVAFHGRHGVILTEYFGQISGTPPWHYPFVMLAVTTPLFTLAMGLLGLWPPARSRTGSPRTATRSLVGLLALSLLFALLPFAQPSAAKYNGVRLFLPALPLLAGLAGLGLEQLRTWLANQPHLHAVPGRWVAATLVTALALPGLVDTLAVHPYPTAFYNRLVGGPAGAERRGLEVSYWGEPLPELLAAVGRLAPQGATFYLHPPGVQAFLGLYSGLGVVRPDLRLIGRPDGPERVDFFLYQNRPSEWDDTARALAAGAKPVYTAYGGEAAVGFVWANHAPDRGQP